MKLWAATLLAIQFALPLRAETVVVRSGEHAEFSRLVLAFEKSTPWHIERLDDGYNLVLDRKNINLDLSKIFRFIPRNRLRDVAFDPDTGTTKLTVTCQCHAEVFEIRPGKLVVDIKDGADPNETASADTHPVKPGTTALIAENMSRPPLQIIGKFAADPLRLKPGEGPVAPGEMFESNPDSAGVAEFQEMLLKELSRAAAQGLVQAEIGLPEIRIPTSEQPPPDQARPLDVSKPAVLPGAPGMHVETSVDQARVAKPDLAVTDQGDACLSERSFDVSAWGGPSTPDRLISDARNGLVGEFDNVDPIALHHLVTTYLFLGFGAEAQALLTAFPPAPDDAPLLRLLAKIMDGEAPPNGDMLNNQLGCDTPAALWGALAQPELPRGADINRAAIVSALSALPIHLRRHLGPGLAERFIAIGDRETATLIRNAIARAEGEAGSEFALMEARLELADGDHPTAEAALESIVAQDDPISAKALIVLMESQLSDGRPPRPEDVLSADALAFEYQNTRTGAKLVRVSVLGSAYNGDFDAAFEKLARDGENTPMPLRSELVTALTKNGSDAAFLRHGFAMLSDHWLPDLEPSAEWAVVQRMLALGFPQQADASLPPRNQTESDDRRLLRARVALANQDAGKALGILAGQIGAEAERIRGDANILLQNTDAALRHYASAGETAPLSHTAWLAGDWKRVVETGTPAQQQFARVRLHKAETVGLTAPDGQPSLSAARALLSESAASRGMVRGLLNEISAPAQ